MIKSKYANNIQVECTDNTFTQKKEEKTHSRISLNEPIFQPMLAKSGYSNKK